MQTIVCWVGEPLRQVPDIFSQASMTLSRYCCLGFCDVMMRGPGSHDKAQDHGSGLVSRFDGKAIVSSGHNSGTGLRTGGIFSSGLMVPSA